MADEFDPFDPFGDEDEDAPALDWLDLLDNEIEAFVEDVVGGDYE